MASPTPADIASWPAPNYVNPNNRTGMVLGLVAPSTALVVIGIALRFYGRGILRQVLGIDDWMMFAATVFSIPVSAIALESLNCGLGIHIWDQREEWQEKYQKLAFTADLLFPICVCLTKISLCLTYLRLFPSKPDRISCYIMSTFVLLYTIVCIFLMLFQCTPIQGFWDRAVTIKCINLRATLVSVAALNSLSDFLVYLWPMKPLWGLQLPTRQKLGLICLFTVGCVVCVAGIVRMYYLEVYFNSYDARWNGAPIYAMMSVEMNLGIVCGCLSGIKPILVSLFPSFFGSSNRTPGTYATPFSGDRSRGVTHPGSFHPLTDLSKSRSEKKTAADQDSLDKEDVERGGITWASARSDGVVLEVPSNAIVVETVVSQEEEKNGSTAASNTTPKGDGESQEWIMEHSTPDGRHN